MAGALGKVALITTVRGSALRPFPRLPSGTVINNTNHQQTRNPVTRMSFAVLGSGSGGNCSALLLQCKNKRKPTVILIDLGLGLRETEKRLHAIDLALHQVDHVILTHFDTDHFRPVWVRRLKKMHATVHFHLDHWPHANRVGAPEFKHRAFDQHPFQLVPGCTVSSTTLAHDDEGTIGFRFDTAAGRLGFATDLGQVPPNLFALFSDLTLLALESNYCPQLQEESDRPYFLKQRIMGGKGHLSNEQSFAAVRRIAEHSPKLNRVILLHLSRECNSPGRILNLYAETPDLSRKLVISNQRSPSNWINLDTTDHGDGRVPAIPISHNLFATPP